VLSVRVRNFTSAIEIPKPTAAGKRDQLSRIDLAGGGANDDQHADQAEHDGCDLPHRHALAEKLTARIAVQIGMVNSDRHHLADRNERSAKNQQSPAP